MDEENNQDDAPAGLPAWVMTFADLMSLLMCFFVLLLSFSEMDVQKYKQIAGSMKMAFGVQREVNVKEIPKGTSIIAKEFSPAKPEKTVVNEVKQSTTAETEGEQIDKPVGQEGKVQSTAEEVAEELEEEIAQGKVEVELENEKIVIRILEKDSFKSASADINQAFKPIMDKIYVAVAGTNGVIKIIGHTDDNPISTPEFRSNWELSSARAVSVAHALLEKGGISEDRIEIIGVADTRPLVKNDSEENRAKNRRVEIIIEKGGTSPAQELLINEGGVELKDIKLEGKKLPKKTEEFVDEIDITDI